MRWVVIAGVIIQGGCSLLLDEDDDPGAGCSTDFDCGSEVCDRRSGDCIGSGEVAYVEADACTPGSACTRGAPCCTVSEGIDIVSATEREVVHVAPGSYMENIEIDDAVVRVIGYGASLTTVPGSSAFRITSGDLRIDGLEIVGAPGDSEQGVEALSAFVSVFQVSIHGHAGDAVSGRDSSQIEIHSSRLFANQAFGVFVQNSMFEIVSSLIRDNGFHGIEVDGGGGSIDFSTVGDNTNGSLTCTVGTPGAVAVRGSILLDSADPPCLDVEPDGGDNFIEGVSPSGAIPRFFARNQRDYRLVEGSPGLDNPQLAGVVASDAIDVDGNPRDDGNGPDYGAHEGAVLLGD